MSFGSPPYDTELTHLSAVAKLQAFESNEVRFRGAGGALGLP